jgi:gluconate 2-dehydrogenase gamma chain
MAKHDDHPDEQPRWDAKLARRSFLKGTAGTLAALLVSRAFHYDVLAETRAREEGFQFFNRSEAETFEAVAARIWPGDEGDPGAREAGAVSYVDRALAGAYAGFQTAYRVALDNLDQDANSRYGVPFRQLEEDQQDALLAELEEVEEEEDPLRGMPGRDFELGLGPTSTFAMFRRHTMEGVFADPIYGGNRDFAGWRAVGYPGAHYIYSAEEQQVFEPLEKPFQSVADL